MNKTTLLTNGRVYTLDAALPKATTIAVRDGKILAVGGDTLLDEFAVGNVESVDLAGRCVVPGLVDSHVHFRNFSLYRRRVNLDFAESLSAVLQRIALYAADSANIEKSGWLRGRGWAQDGWVDNRFPTAADLDQIAGQIPACMIHKSGHAAWVNSKALRMAGVTENTPDPPGGQIQRDAAGRPTGILFEDAMNLVTHFIPPPVHEEVVAAMREGQHYCWQVGLTGIHDFDGRSCFLALQELHAQRELGLRVVKNIPVACWNMPSAWACVPALAMNGCELAASRSSRMARSVRERRRWSSRMRTTPVTMASLLPKRKR